MIMRIFSIILFVAINVTHMLSFDFNGENSGYSPIQIINCSFYSIYRSFSGVLGKDLYRQEVLKFKIIWHIFDNVYLPIVVSSNAIHH